MPQFAGEGFDLILGVGDRALERDDVLHRLGAAQKLLQAVELDLRGLETGFHVVIALADVLRALGLVAHAAQLPDLVQERLELRRRNTDGVAGTAVAGGIVVAALLLKVAAELIRQRDDVALRLFKLGGLQLQIGAVDHLDALGDVGAGTALRAAVACRRLRFHRHLGVPVCLLHRLRRRHAVGGSAVKRRAAAGGVPRRGAAAGGQAEDQHKGQQNRNASFLHLIHLKSHILGLAD